MPSRLAGRALALRLLRCGIVHSEWAPHRAQIEYNANSRDFVSDLYDVTLTAKSERGAKKAIGLKHIIRCVLCAAHSHGTACASQQLCAAAAVCVRGSAV